MGRRVKTRRPIVSTHIHIIFINYSQFFLFFSILPLDKSKNHGIIKVTKGKKSKTFSRGTTQIQRSTRICSLPIQNNLRRFSPEMCTWDIDARVKRKVERKFRSGTDKRRRKTFFSHVWLSEKVAGKNQERFRFASAEEGGTVCTDRI